MSDLEREWRSAAEGEGEAELCEREERKEREREAHEREERKEREARVAEARERKERQEERLEREARGRNVKAGSRRWGSRPAWGGGRSRFLWAGRGHGRIMQLICI